MAPIRLQRSQLWLLIPLGWALVGIVGSWLVVPMILVTVLLGGGLSRRGRCGPRLERRREQLERRQAHLDARSARWEERHAIPTPARPTVDLTKRTPAETLASLADSAALPGDIRERAQRLDRDCAEALDYLRQHGAPTEQVFQVEQIHTDFGPQALRSYLALAPGTADTTEVLDGRTGHQLIVEQLDLLLTQVAAQLNHAVKLGSDELLANHRFLTQKFGTNGDSELTI